MKIDTNVGLSEKWNGIKWTFKMLGGYLYFPQGKLTWCFHCSRSEWPIACNCLHGHLTSTLNCMLVFLAHHVRLGMASPCPEHRCPSGMTWMTCQHRGQNSDLALGKARFFIPQEWWLSSTGRSGGGADLLRDPHELSLVHGQSEPSGRMWSRPPGQAVGNSDFSLLFFQ